MTFAMLRRFSTAALVLAAMGAVLAVSPERASAAKPSTGPSPFAGTYRGFVPGSWSYWGWTITIDDAGDVAGSYYEESRDPFFWEMRSGGFDGHVSGDGSMSIGGKEGRYGSVAGKGGGSYSEKQNIRFFATVVLDDSSNLTGATRDGMTFTWYRQ